MTAGFTISHQCPQCGAPAELLETDRLFSCRFCRVRSCLLPGDGFRYLLPAKDPKAQDLVYFPYWRYRAMVFSAGVGGIREQVVDLSAQAALSERFPVSVGLRGQTLKLRFATPDTPGRWVAPTLLSAKAVAHFESRKSLHEPGPALFKAHIGDPPSLLFAPFKITDPILDAITMTPLSTGKGAGPDPETLPFSRLNWRIRFVPTLCPHCGRDLDGERDSLVLTCPGCEKAWGAVGHTLKPIETSHAHSVDEDPFHLPFWCFAARVSGVRLERVEDLVRVCNLPRVVRGPEADRPVLFWVPAFKAPPRLFMRLATNLTRFQPDLRMTQGVPAGKKASANLALTEAMESLQVVLAGCVRPARALWALADRLEVTARKFRLVYLPMKEGPHEYTHPALPVTVHKQVFRNVLNF